MLCTTLWSKFYEFEVETSIFVLPCARITEYLSDKTTVLRFAMNKRDWGEFSHPLAFFAVTLHAVAGCSTSNRNVTDSRAVGGMTVTVGAGTSTGTGGTAWARAGNR